MAKATPGSLSRSELLLLAETEAANLKTLDEDGLLALHDRTRRARNKHVQLHRREVGQQVGVTRARGTASVPPRRSASKAELFEGGLARVSAALAKSARQSAAELRAARLAAAKRPSTTGAPTRRTAATKSASGRAAKPSSGGRRRRAVERKTTASEKAAGARRQAKRDAR